MTIPPEQRVPPRTLAGILKLCGKSENCRLEADQADAMMAGPGRSTAFIAMCRHHYGCGASMELRDLAKLMRKNNEFWGIALVAAVERLKRAGVLAPDYSIPDGVVPPKERHPKGFRLA